MFVSALGLQVGPGTDNCQRHDETLARRLRTNRDAAHGDRREFERSSETHIEVEEILGRSANSPQPLCAGVELHPRFSASLVLFLTEAETHGYDLTYG